MFQLVHTNPLIKQFVMFVGKMLIVVWIATKKVKLILVMSVVKSIQKEGSTEVTSFDLCGECFEKKLVPFLKSLGANPTVEDKDY